MLSRTASLALPLASSPPASRGGYSVTLEALSREKVCIALYALLSLSSLLSLQQWERGWGMHGGCLKNFGVAWNIWGLVEYASMRCYRCLLCDGSCFAGDDPDGSSHCCLSCLRRIP